MKKNLSERKRIVMESLEKEFGKIGHDIATYKSRYLLTNPYRFMLVFNKRFWL